MAHHLVFVYGTLKTGEPNHPLLNDTSNGQSEFVGRAKTDQKFPLVIASIYNIPYLLYKPGVGHNIIGEVYKIDDKMLSFLDEFECHPGYYTRTKEKVILEDGSELMVWIYILHDFQSELLDLPRIGDYSSYGSHGLPYVERWEREQSNDGSYEKNDVIHQIKLFL